MSVKIADTITPESEEMRHAFCSVLMELAENNKDIVVLDADLMGAMGTKAFAKKFEDFGWYAQDIDGNDVQAIDNAIDRARAQHEKPSMIVLNTIKGDGWSSVANKSSCHNLTISPAQLQEAMDEMNAALKRIEEGE